MGQRRQPVIWTAGPQALSLFVTAALDFRVPSADNAEAPSWRTPTVTPEQKARQQIDQQPAQCG
jgi:hypothetical protein